MTAIQMNTCDTCQHWDSEHETDEPGLFACKAAHTSADDGRAFGVANGEPLNAGEFATGPKFGCVHWEPK